MSLSESVAAAPDRARSVSAAPPKRCRSFGLIDCMIWVAAFALAFTAARPDIHHVLGDPIGQRHKLATVLVPLLVCLSAAVFASRLVRPWPSVRRMMREPGTLAVAVVIAVLAGHGLFILAMAVPPTQGDSALWLKRWYSFHSAQLASGLVFASLLVGPITLGAWGAIWLGGSRRPAQSWVDRAGRLLGVCWIAYSLVGAGICFRGGRGAIKCTIIATVQPFQAVSLVPGAPTGNWLPQPAPAPQSGEPPPMPMPPETPLPMPPPQNTVLNTHR